MFNRLFTDDARTGSDVLPSGGQEGLSATDAAGGDNSIPFH